MAVTFGIAVIHNSFFISLFSFVQEAIRKEFVQIKIEILTCVFWIILLYLGPEGNNLKDLAENV